jgi:hypothetical protein
MAKKLDPRLLDILTKYEEDVSAAIWDCHGTWVAYHAAIERIAAKAGVTYSAPTVLVASPEAAAILVTGTLGDKTEWSVGEAAINVNYRVSGKQAAYPFAMAEKRGKDRVVLKLVGLHGLVYSEEESDDFKTSGTPNTVTGPAVQSSAALKRAGSWPELQKQLYDDFGDCKSLVTLSKLRADYREKAKAQGWTKAWLEALANEFDQFEDSLQSDNTFPGDTPNSYVNNLAAG